MSPAAGDHGAVHDHRASGELTIRPVTGLGEFGPASDLAAEIRSAAPWLSDGDIVVVTSKVFSKIEGRMVAAPADPEQRNTVRRSLIEEEAVRVVARRDELLITENRNGLIQAAAGVDGSNVPGDHLALLPVDPDASAARLRADLAGHGLDVAVLVTDTMGRAWRAGQTDVAIGASGMSVRHGYAGAVDGYGNPLAVTDIAVADEIAAAADLVKGKLGGVPVAVISGLAPVDDGSTARDLIREPASDLFRLGTDEALAQGRIEALLTRRSVRTFAPGRLNPESMHACFAEALTAPAPHHSRPVRFLWIRDNARRAALLDAMTEQWRRDLKADGKGAKAIDQRVRRGQILYDAPELVIPVLTAEGMHAYRDDRRNACEQTMFTVAGGAAVGSFLIALSVRGIGSCWVGSTIFAAATVRHVLDLPADWQPLGAVAIGHPAAPAGLRGPADIAGRVIEL